MNQDKDKINTSIQTYMAKYKELETAKIELQNQKEQVNKQLSTVEQNIIYLQGAIRALQELTTPEETLEGENK